MTEVIWRDFDGSEVKFVNIYEVTRHYGGPEEGGWWYDAGTPVETFVVPQSQQPKISSHVERLRNIWQDNGNRFSVVPRDEDYAVMIEDHPARGWPETKPHYE